MQNFTVEGHVRMKVKVIMQSRSVTKWKYSHGNVQNMLFTQLLQCSSIIAFEIASIIGSHVPRVSFLYRHYKPLIKDLISWPRINLDAPPGFSPFDAPVSMRTRSRCSSKSPGRRTKRKTNKQSSGSGFKRGYCELCYVNYAGIEKHIGSRMHRLIASNDETYAELDRLIGRGKSLEEFEADLRRKKAEEDDFNKRTRRYLSHINYTTHVSIQALGP